MRQAISAGDPIGDHQAARSAAIAAMGHRLAAGGLGIRPEHLGRSAAPPAADDFWASLLPQGLAENRYVRRLLSIGDDPRGAEDAGRRTIPVMSQTTLLCLAAAVGSSLLLYWGKSRADMLDRDVGRVIRATQEARAQTYVLRGEWASLNDPGRLQDMTDRYLALRTIAPSQYVQLAGLQDRLLTPVVPPTPPQPDVGAASAAEVAEKDAEPLRHAADPKASARTVVADAAAPSVRPRLPSGAPHGVSMVLAHFEPAQHPLHQAPAPKFALPHWVTDAHAPRPAVRVMSEPPHMLALPQGTPLPLAAPQPVRASSMPAMARAQPEPDRPAVVAAVPSYPTAVPYARSAYGYPYGAPYAYAYQSPYGRPYLPPPVPSSRYYYQ